MKAFVGAILVFVLMIGGILWYELSINKKQDEISEIITKTETAIFNEDIKTAEKNIKILTDEWDKLQNHLMMFNDHKDINEMSKALKTLTAFSEYEKYDEMYVSLENFKLLFKYAVESSKPTLANIL